MFLFRQWRSSPSGRTFAPEEIESQVTRPIEEAESAAPNVATVQSTSSTGVSTVRVQFAWGTDVGQGAIDVLQLVEKARQNFPTDPTLQDPIVYKYDPSQLPILIYAVSGESNSVKLRTELDNEISPIVESASGVASAVVTGGNDRAILVNADPNKLLAYHVSMDQISTRIAQENQNVPAGIGLQSRTEYTIRSLGWFKNPQEIAKVPLTLANGRVVTIGDVATIVDADQEPRLFTRLNGSPAAGMIIAKQSNSNTIDTAKAVEAKIKDIEKRYPNLHFELAYDQSQYISNSIDDLKLNAALGGVLAVLILLFFLRNVRSTLVVALSIPISIISTFALLYVCGFTLNTMSLGGLALATGLIADDAVVVLENIYRHYDRDKMRPAEAAIAGANEIFSAVIASTITIIVVFLPLLLIKGQAGQMFTQFALVVIFSILVSLLDATTVVPMLASRLIKEHSADDDANGMDSEGGSNKGLFGVFGRWFGALDASYHRGLGWAIRHRIAVVSLALGITALSFLLVPQIGSELLPQTDSGNLQVTVKLPPGTALADTNKLMKQIEQITLANPNVQTVFSAAGSNLTLSGTTTALNGNQGALQVRLKDNRKQSTQQVVQDLHKQLARVPGGRISVTVVDIVSRILTGGDANVEADIYGPNLDTLSKLGAQATGKLKAIPGLTNVDVNWQDTEPEIQWQVNRDAAEQQGVTFQDVSDAIDTATNGNTASYYQEDGYQYAIVVEVAPDLRRTTSQLATLPVYPSVNTDTTHAVLLQQVATPVYADGPASITRQDRQRYIAVTGTPQGRSAGDLQKDIAKQMATIKLPAGYYWDWGYSQKQQAQEFSGMALAIGLAIGLIYMLLAAQFESFVHPLTILCSVPVSAVGVLLALFLTGRHFGLTALIGMLMLVGIVVKNGILLVDYTNLLRRQGLSRDEAVLRAGPTRLRPILMTSSAAILGMIPIALALGKGSETNAPMATVVIGGLLTSTFLTLFVVPIAYTLFDDLGRRFRKDDRDFSPPVLVEPTPAGVGTGGPPNPQ